VVLSSITRRARSLIQNLVPAGEKNYISRPKIRAIAQDPCHLLTSVRIYYVGIKRNVGGYTGSLLLGLEKDDEEDEELSESRTQNYELLSKRDSFNFKTVESKTLKSKYGPPSDENR